MPPYGQPPGGQACPLPACEKLRGEVYAARYQGVNARGSARGPEGGREAVGGRPEPSGAGGRRLDVAGRNRREWLLAGRDGVRMAAGPDDSNGTRWVGVREGLRLGWWVPRRRATARTHGQGRCPTPRAPKCPRRNGGSRGSRPSPVAAVTEPTTVVTLRDGVRPREVRPATRTRPKRASVLARIEQG